MVCASCVLKSICYNKLFKDIKILFYPYIISLLSGCSLHMEGVFYTQEKHYPQTSMWSLGMFLMVKGI